MSRPVELRVILRTGIEVVADVDEASVEVAESTQTGQLTHLAWTSTDTPTARLLYVDPAEIAAVVVRTPPATQPPEEGATADG